MITHISTIVYSNVNGVGNFLETEGFVMNNVLYRDRSLPFLTAGGFRNICYREWGDPKILRSLYVYMVYQEIG